MNKNYKIELINYVKQLNSSAEIVFIDPKELIFEEVAKMNCFYCGKYNNNWRCPPHLPDNIDYKKMMEEFDAGLFLILTYDITSKEQFAVVRNESSVAVHRILLDLEKWMYNHNSSTAISFIGGSCKLCKGGCGKEKCNNPYMSRSPIEALGINVIKSASRYGINIEFPTDKQLMRIGMLLWQEGDN